MSRPHDAEHPGHHEGEFRLDLIGSAFPEVEIDARWNINLRCRMTARIWCIQGMSLKCQCKGCDHGSDCKMHVDIAGTFVEAQGALLKWAMFGASCNTDAHKEAASDCQRDWRAFIQRPG